MKQRESEVIVIGGGFSGLSCAICLAHAGFEVTLLEQHSQTGGRARIFEKDGFRFDMGPSWYWMPEVTEQLFNRVGRSANDYLKLVRLDPSYKVIFGGHEYFDMPASTHDLKQLFDNVEPGAGDRLGVFLKEAEYKYKTALKTYIKKPGLSPLEYLSMDVFRSVCKMDMFTPVSKHIRRFFKDERLLKIVEFPVLFLGATPARIPALYSLMNYADMVLGTWYPMGGMYELTKALTAVAIELGVNIELNTKVSRILSKSEKVTGVQIDDRELNADIIVSGADYHHTDQILLGSDKTNYSKKYWEKRDMSPSCLLYYVGVSKKLPFLQHHNLFFENDFAQHARAIYEDKTWPQNPLFYLCCPSKTDTSVAPEGMENLFFLIPTAPGLADNEQVREYYFSEVVKKTEQYCGENLSGSIVCKEVYGHNDFVRDYNAFQGNAYGLANTLRQTAFLRPSIRHKTFDNLFYTGQLTVPGPGVPPAILSGQLVADYIIKTGNDERYF